MASSPVPSASHDDALDDATWFMSLIASMHRKPAGALLCAVPASYAGPSVSQSPAVAYATRAVEAAGAGHFRLMLARRSPGAGSVVRVRAAAAVSAAESASRAAVDAAGGALARHELAVERLASRAASVVASARGSTTRA